ncbi:MAG: gamma-glutamylcyclotransferase [Planctomycetia bacterium]|nr:gamma-glutamylcyclotransferase [Planctomycetia bacterium]
MSLPLFAFGTLRCGEENHNFLDGTYDRCLAGTLPDFRKTIAAHGYPAVVPSPGDCVYGDLFFIRPDLYDQTLSRCDLLEDLTPGQLTGRYYRRAQVTIETDEGPFAAWAYLVP